MGATFPVEALERSFMKLGDVAGLVWTVALKETAAAWL